MAARAQSLADEVRKATKSLEKHRKATKTGGVEAVSHGVTSMPKLRVTDVHLSPLNEARSCEIRVLEPVLEAQGADFDANQEIFMFFHVLSNVFQCFSMFFMDFHGLSWIFEAVDLTPSIF